MAQSDDPEELIRETLEAIRHDLNQELDRWSTDLKEVIARRLEVQLSDQLREIARQEASKLLQGRKDAPLDSPRHPYRAIDHPEPEPNLRRNPAETQEERATALYPRLQNQVGPDRRWRRVWRSVAAWRWGIIGSALLVVFVVYMLIQVLVPTGPPRQPLQPLPKESGDTSPTPRTAKSTDDNSRLLRIFMNHLGGAGEKWSDACRKGSFTQVVDRVLQSERVKARVRKVLQTYVESPSTLTDTDKVVMKHALVQDFLNGRGQSENRLTIDGDISWPTIDQPLYSSAPRLETFLNEEYLPSKGVLPRNSQAPLRRLTQGNGEFPDLLEDLMSAVLVEHVLKEHLDQ